MGNYLAANCVRFGGPETLSATESQTFRFRHPKGRELDLMVRRIAPWNPPLN